MTPKQIHKILCPVDFSETSEGALRYAAALASCWKADIVVIHAYKFQPPPYFTESQIEQITAQLDEARGNIENSLREFAKKALDELPENLEAAVVEGSARDSILEAASTFSADLIVMGTHGYSGLRRFLLGSVAENVLHSSEIPVLMIRPDTAPPESEIVIKNVICPVNQTPAARESVGYAVSLAGCHGAALTLLHVKESAHEPAVANWCSWASVERSNCQIQEMTREGKVAEEVLKQASETGCDLLVVGAWHRPLLDRTVIGSTTAVIVRNAACPVLIVPAKARDAG